MTGKNPLATYPLTMTSRNEMGIAAIANSIITNTNVNNMNWS